VFTFPTYQPSSTTDGSPGYIFVGPHGDGDIVATITVEAGDLYFEGIPETLPAGTIEIVLENVGDMPHDVTVEELDDEVVVAAGGGESNTGTVTLEPGVQEDAMEFRLEADTGTRGQRVGHVGLEIEPTIPTENCPQSE
jgi:hypothetical protein